MKIKLPFNWKIKLTPFVMAILFCSGMARADFNPQRMGLSYSYPTNYTDWGNAFLAGNGKMGIMVFGNPLHETTIFNDRGFNLAKNGDRSFALVSAADLEAIRSNCAAGNFAEANRLAVSSAHYGGGGEGNRHPGYEMLISIPESGSISNYSRTCNFRTGEIDVNWSDSRGNWVRKAFVSRKDNVIVQYLTAPTRGTMTCSIELATDPKMSFPPGMSFTNLSSVDWLNLRGKYPRDTGGAGYEGVTKVVADGGTKSLNGNVLTISNAKSVLLLTRMAKYYTNAESQWDQQGLQHQLAGISPHYATLLKGQIATHGAIYDRVKLDLGATAADRARSNEELLSLQKKSSTAVKALWERLFDAGRYYYLSSSSELTPPDLLGIWTGDCNAGWGGYYHLDANVNLQIAGGNIGDMPEAMEGYFKINESWREGFQTNAQKLLGCRGMVAAGNTPGTGAGLLAGISDFYPYQYATGEESWLLYPFWEHYLITGDTNFLRNRLYPLLKDMGYFYEDFLTKTDAAGHYILAGSVSPENQPANVKVSLLNNSTFDLSGARFALSTLIQTCNTLGLDQGEGGRVEKWTKLLNNLPPYLINAEGALQEWSWPGLNDNFNHRHSSGLLPIWPFREFTPETAPTLFNAAATTLQKKDAFNYENAGHGILHAALIAAGVNNDHSVNQKLMRLSKEDFYYSSLCSSHYSGHGVFCTDTCNAVPGIMMEMLVSSRPGVLELLPAVPQSLAQGAISGVKGRNRVTVQNLSWNLNDKTVTCVLKSDITQDLTLIQRREIRTFKTNAKVTPSALGQIARTIHLEAGVSTEMSLGLGDVPAKDQPLQNLALGRPVTVSSVADDCPGVNAVDGDVGTRWSSAYTDNEWIYVDLGSVKNVTGVKLEWEVSHAKAYKIQVSNDALTWTDAYNNTNGVGGVERLVFAAQGRYVRMLGVQRSNAYGYSLWELEVYDNPQPSAPPRAQANVYNSELNIPYCTVQGKELKLNAFLPRNVAASTPAIVDIHGGWWHGGEAAHSYESVGGWQLFTRRGLAIFSVEYRLGREGGFPENIRDCRNAIRFIRQNAKRFNIDPERIDVTGGSAGGYLSLMVAMVQDDFKDGGPTPGLEGVSARVSGSFSFIPPTDFVRFWNQGPDDAVTNLDGKVSFRGPDDNIPYDSRPRLRVLFHGLTPDTDAHRAIYAQTCPMGQVRNDVVPLLICDGEKDPIVPGLHGKALYDKLQSVGADATYWVSVGAGHGFPSGTGFPNVLDRFIRRTLDLDGRQQH